MKKIRSTKAPAAAFLAATGARRACCVNAFLVRGDSDVVSPPNLEPFRHRNLNGDIDPAFEPFLAEFCSSAPDAIEPFLDRALAGIMGDDFSTEGFVCSCSPELFSDGLLRIDCRSLYSSGGGNFRNAEWVALDPILADGEWQFAPKSVGWCDGIANGYEEHCENFSYCDGDIGDKLCSCSASSTTGGSCASCEICADGKQIAIDCSGEDQFIDYTSTCEDSKEDANTGAFLTGFDFGGLSISAPDEAIDPAFQPYLAEFCSSVPDKMEPFLDRELAGIMGDDFSATEGFVCSCSPKLFSGGLLRIDCGSIYSSGGESFRNAEWVALDPVLTNGEWRFLPKSVGWCDGNADGYEKHCERFDYCEGGEDNDNLCSCSASSTTGGGCTSCVVCPDGKQIAMDCSGEDQIINYTSSCEDGEDDANMGAFLTAFDFGNVSISAPDEAVDLPDVDFNGGYTPLVASSAGAFRDGEILFKYAVFAAAAFLLNN